MNNHLAPFTDSPICPKCGGEDIALRYRPAFLDDSSFADRGGITVPFLQHTCSDCLYEWAMCCKDSVS